MRSLGRWFRAGGAVAGAAALVLSCGGGKDATAPVPAVATVVITSPAAAPTLAALGRTVQFAAEARDASGNPVPGQTIVWTSSNTAVATITSAGIATAAGNGTTTVAASAGGQSASLVLIVAQAVAQVAVTPASVTFGAAGRTGQFGASASDSNGNPIAGKTFTWASSNAAVVTVDAAGLATAVANGTAQVRATADGVTGSATVTVDIVVATMTLSPASATLTLINATTPIVAAAKDSGGGAIANPRLTWTSRAPAVISVDSTGTVKAIEEGSGYVVAAATSGASDSALITVSVYYASIGVSPAAVTLTALGATQRLAATVQDSNGTAVPNAVARFSVTAHGAATVDSVSGLVTARAVGADTVTVTARTASVTVPVTVQQNVSTITVTPATATLFTQGRTAQFTAAAADANGNAIPATTFAWTSSNTAVATVDAGTGLATAVNDGTAQIRAAAGGKTGSASLTVSRVVVTVSVQSASLRKLDTLTTISGTLGYTGTATDSSGATIAGQSFSWVSRRTATATVSPASGASTTATAVANGTTVIVGTAGTKSDSATLVVNAPVPAGAAVNVGNNFFTSVANGSSNPAVDTIAVGGTVTWTWRESGVNHTVQSLGSPSFTSSGIMNTNGATYSVTFLTAGTYTYDCAVHGTIMSGTIVVQ